MSKSWFAPKRVGYGSSWPIRWEGWIVLIGFFAAVAGSRALIYTYAPPDYARLLWFAALGVLILALALIAHARTDGGWRWRKGDD